MYHPELNIEYPPCPYVWNYQDMTELYQCEYRESSNEEIIENMKRIFLSSIDENSSQDNTIIQEKIMFILEKIQKDDNINKKIYSCHQKLNAGKQSGEIKHHLNFHTTCYCNAKGKMLDSDYVTNANWSVVPIFGSLTTGDEQKKVSLRRQTTKEPVYDKFHNDVQTSQEKKTINNERMAKRGIYSHEFHQDELKKGGDNYSDVQKNFGNNVQKIKRLPFTTRNRAQANEFRHAMTSEFKINRIKQNPQLYQERPVVDVYNNKNMKNKMEKDTITELKSEGFFNFKNEPINIHQVGGIYRFSPFGTGRIIIKSNPTRKIEFISFVRMNNDLIITYHEIQL